MVTLLDVCPNCQLTSSPTKKYSRLAACSRTSSMRENPATETPMNIPVGAAKPPNYSDLFDHSGSSSLASSPPRYSSKTPSVEISSSNEEIVKTEGEAQAQAPVAPRKPKISLKPKKAQKEDQVKIIMDDQEEKK